MNRIARNATRLAAVGGALLATGCLGTTEPAESLLWEGTLLVTENGPADLTGAAAMVALTSHTQLGIGVHGAPVEAVYGWLMRNGTCDAPGTAVAPASAFPPLEVDAGGDFETEVVIQRRLAGTEYAVQVVENTDGSGDVLACADLMRT